MRIAVIGGDKRMLYCAKAFSDEGAEVSISGFDNLISDCGIRVLGYREAAEWADIIVLPIRPVNGGVLFAPYFRESIMAEDLSRYTSGKPVFCGNSDALNGIFDSRFYDYGNREDFAIANAVLTAEGALETVFREYEDSVYGSKVLVLGYGRIGRILSGYLKDLGADVTAAARKPEARAWITAEGIKACDYSLKEINRFQLIFNTVPATVLNAQTIERLDPEAFIIDLASAPGGVDRIAAEKRDITCIHALALPGRTAPKAAGRIIKNTILRIIEEENGGKDNFGLRDDRLLLHL